MKIVKTVLVALAVTLLSAMLAPSAYANAFLGPDLSTFAILGGGGVAVNGTGSVITGSVGAFPTTTITGLPAAGTVSGGTVQSGGAIATAAQLQLGTAMTALGLLPALGGSLSLINVATTLTPGVYSASSTLILNSALTLNGQGNPNALWVFLVGSSLTANVGSAVTVINPGANPGVYWVMQAGSATLNGAAFAGNVYANQSITMGTSVTMCGRLATQVASVTLAGTDTISNVCSNAGFGGGGGPGITPVPESGTFVLVGCGIFCLVALTKLG